MVPASRVTFRGVIARQFFERFGRRPETVVRSPGRVNLIGEHTDYSLLPVMPMAIDRGIDLAIAPLDEPVIIADSLALPDPVRLAVPVRPQGLSGWHRYLAAMVDAVADGGRGFELLIGGDLPVTGGLSSSSALSVGVLEALNRVWDLGLPRHRYPAMALGAERSIGIEGGMMDQTVISLARRGHAARIDFAPLAIRHVPIDPRLRLVAAFSGVPALKGSEARDSYNLRVVACRAAALLLGCELDRPVGDEPVLLHVASAPEINRLVARLPAEATAAEVSLLVGESPDRMVRLGTGRFAVEATLPVRAVARHVLAEAGRVDAAEAALVSGDLVGFGRLLDESHRSLQDFGVSSPPLDSLVGAMREAGAWGARLTGAGFGGYAIAAAPAGAVDRVMAAAVATTGGPAFEVAASDGVG